jgi:deferrochelatase/peroxidase EfeB
MPGNYKMTSSFAQYVSKDLNKRDEILRRLQANIVKAHVRDHLEVLFIHFKNPDAGMRFLNEVAGSMKNALEHLEEARRFRECRTPGSTYVGVGLTDQGYEALDIEAWKRPDGQYFADGMRSAISRAELGDPAVEQWERLYRKDIHGIVMIGDASAEAAKPASDQIRALLDRYGSNVELMGVEVGRALTNPNGDPIEHFGYVDGRSQPLFVSDDLDDEATVDGGTSVWNPESGLDQILVQDPAAPDPRVGFGSYLVFRKLEQNVRQFKLMVHELATHLNADRLDPAYAGALIIGRFKDGTPLALQAAPGMWRPVPNNFDYAGDVDGMKCPYFAHIRKMNPRGSGPEPPQDQRRHLMARRGQTYGYRDDDPTDDRIWDKPTEGVGLLFMAFNADVGDQFVYAQRELANESELLAPVFSKLSVPDLLIGQAHRPATVFYPRTWGGDPVSENRTAPAFRRAVTMKGGAYFFMPSLDFLRARNPAWARRWAPWR